MSLVQKHPVVRISILCGILGLIGLALAGVAPVSVAQAPASPAANTVNHFYNGMDASAGYNILDDQSAERGVFTTFTFPDTTFHSTDGAALTYTTGGKPGWLIWLPASRTFYGTPGTGLLPAYTITVTATSATGGSDSLTFTLKVANVAPETGQKVPVFGDPAGEFAIAHLSPAGTPIYPTTPITATDANGNLMGYRFVAPVGVTIPFTIDNTGLISATEAFPVAPGKYYYTLEAYDATGYQDTSHIVINVEKTGLSWTGATSSDWHTASNWTGGLGAPDAPAFSAVPDDQTNVTVSAGTPYSPTITASASSYRLSLSGAVSLTMNADLYVGNEVDLLGTSLNTSAATLTLGGVSSPIGFVTTGNSEGWGNFRRINLAAGLPYDFGHPDTQLTFHGGTGLAETTVKIVPSAPAGAWLCALARTYRISVPGWTAGTADLRLRYTPTDGTCAPLKLYRAPAGTANWSEVPGAVSGGVSPNWYLSVIGQATISGYDFALGNLCDSASTVTNNADSGTGSLRQAIAEVCPGGTITFDNDYTITLGSELALNKSLTIDSGSHVVTVSGNDATRVFNVAADVKATLQDLTIAHGAINEGNGGGILNQGVLTVTRCLLADNLAWPAPYSGGSLYNSALSQLTVISSTFTHNGAAGGGAGIFNDGLAQVSSSTFSNGGSGYASSSGAGIANLGVLTVTNSLFDGNSAPQGAGLSNGDPNSRLTVYGSTFKGNTGSGGAGMDNYGTAEVYDSIFTDNRSDTSLGPNGGGGIYNFATLTVTHSTFFANFAYPGGGIHNDGNLTVLDSVFSGNMARYGSGLYNTGALTLTNSLFVTNSITTGAGGGLYNSGTVSMANSTVSSNTASLGNGGGIYNLGALTITHSTLSHNSAATIPPNPGGQGGGLYNSGTLAAYNTLIANSPGGSDCVTTGTISANVHNLIEDGSCSALLSGDPQLTPLTVEGVHALLPTSPAIDAGDAASCLPSDQRGETRDDLQCDIGAYELKYADSPTVIRAISGATATTFGPALIAIQRDVAFTNPGIITATKKAWSRQGPESIGAQWAITPTTTSGFSLTLQLCYTETELGSLTESNLRFWSSDGTTWTAYPTTPAFSMIDGYHCATLSGIDHLSRWTLATDTPTAVTLQTFTAQSSAPTAFLPLLALTATGVFVILRRRRAH